MIDLQSLRYSILVADHRSFRKAALVIGVGQSVISRRIRTLEDAIGVSIFERYSGGVRLTNAGSDFLRVIRKAVQDIDVAISAAGSAGRGSTGRLVLGFCSSLSTGELRKTLIDYVLRYPKVAVRAIEGSRSQLIASLNSKTTDIAVIPGRIDDESLDAMPLWNERIMLAVPAVHRLVTFCKIHWRDVKHEQFIISSRDAGLDVHEFLINRLSCGARRPAVISHDVSRENVLAMVAAGQGISLLHECATGVSVPGVTYREIYDEGSPACVATAAFWYAGNDNPALRRFLSLLRGRYVGGSPFLPLIEE
jgi:DNA-binding transcriptional LysR family regulator